MKLIPSQFNTFSLTVRYNFKKHMILPFHIFNRFKFWSWLWLKVLWAFTMNKFDNRFLIRLARPSCILALQVEELSDNWAIWTVGDDPLLESGIHGSEDKRETRVKGINTLRNVSDETFGLLLESDGWARMKFRVRRKDFCRSKADSSPLFHSTGKKDTHSLPPGKDSALSQRLWSNDFADGNRQEVLHLVEIHTQGRAEKINPVDWEFNFCVSIALWEIYTPRRRSRAQIVQLQTPALAFVDVILNARAQTTL